MIYIKPKSILNTLSIPPIPLWGALGLSEISEPRLFSTPWSLWVKIIQILNWEDDKRDISPKSLLNSLKFKFVCERVTQNSSFELKGHQPISDINDKKIHQEKVGRLGNWYRRATSRASLKNKINFPKSVFWSSLYWPFVALSRWILSLNVAPSACFSSHQALIEKPMVPILEQICTIIQMKIYHIYYLTPSYINWCWTKLFNILLHFINLQSQWHFVCSSLRPSWSPRAQTCYFETSLK